MGERSDAAVAAFVKIAPLGGAIFYARAFVSAIYGPAAAASAGRHCLIKSLKFMV